MKLGPSKGTYFFRPSGREILNSETVEIADEPTWFGSPESPLFGWISHPKSAAVRGRVVIVPSVGYEARSAKAAMRYLAWSLARSGFIALRFDFRGTGDSCGDFGDYLPGTDWINDTVSAIKFVQADDSRPVSIVGFRLGATIAAATISNPTIDIGSLVLWDPCESGWGYLRELRALESLRREMPIGDEDGSVETTEFLFPEDMVSSLRSIKLNSLLQSENVERTLVITRTARPLSTTLREQLEMKGAAFATTDEQEKLLEVSPFEAAIPHATTAATVAWLSDTDFQSTTVPPPTPTIEALLPTKSDEHTIRERALFLDELGIFAFFCEPVGPHTGPWIVMIGNVDDDHTGQSRIWVELSRRWAQTGLRCVRVDLSGLGESSRPNQAPMVEHFDSRWIRDVVALAPFLDPEDPTNVVFVGFCASATFAMEGALAVNAKGVCLINPAPGRNLSHAIYRLKESPSRLSGIVAMRLSQLLLNHPWVATNAWETLRRGFPGRWSKDILQEIEEAGTDILVLSNAEDRTVFRCEGYVRSIREFKSNITRNFQFRQVPDLDHEMTVAAGRSRTVKLLEDHITSTFISIEVNSGVAEI